MWLCSVRPDCKSVLYVNSSRPLKRSSCVQSNCCSTHMRPCKICVQHNIEIKPRGCKLAILAKLTDQGGVQH